ncbi:DUF2786 domain-containing protein [Aeromicrobium sp. 9AM]|uniref:DUF2786 domain-containing protein n=1 Tax=Aeromicrobium sp. 9AM TaxID=2653126 RepID=UPI0012EFB61A|nr:DUF2786 domain-containing protein [Aeromicrobium sp. 9AM]VXB94597.1 conserved hypothetical protein [Aeromicrobium sp. 9AM]
MGKNSRKRREARRRTHGSTPRPASHAVGTGTWRPGVTQAELIDLISMAARYAVAAPRAAGSRIRQLNQLAADADSPQVNPAALVVDEVLSRLAQAWEYGWQPQDLVHAARRRTSFSAAGWLARAVLVDAQRSRAMQRAPDVWRVQLSLLAARQGGAGDSASLLSPGGDASEADWVIALIALDFMHDLPRSQLLTPPPSQWGRARRTASAPASEEHAKTVARVRALLAKAESTEFAPEAEAFTAKAQDIMTRHAIDEALLAEEAGQIVDVQGIRVLIDHPYALEKARLLDVIARANQVRAVWNDFASCMTLLGVPTDLEQVEMLFTSTLVQATRAMTQAGQRARPSAGERSSSFRKAFLSAYATRIGERLATSFAEAAATYGADLVPVFERRADAIDGEFERLFPHVTTGSRRAMFDADGWDAGTRAADAATLPAGSIEG